MTRAIALMLSCLVWTVWAAPGYAETVRVAGTGGALEAMRLAGEAFQRTHPQTNIAIVRGLGSRGGPRAVEAGAVDLAISASPAPGDETGLLWVELGRTPIIFTTASRGAGAGVTMADLVEIYSGRRTAWPDGSRLRVILRPHGNSSTAILRTLSPAMNRAIEDGFKLPGVNIAATDHDAASAIGSIPGAFGTSTLLQARAEARPLAPLSVDGIAPGLAALANGSYPHAKTLYLVTRRQSGGAAHQFLAFLASPGGRELLTGLGLQVSPGLTAALHDVR